MSLFSIQAALLGLPPDMAQPLRARVNTFAQRLYEQRRLHIRDDSRLVWSFVTQTLPEGWDETKVMDELCLLQYIHQYTDYVQQYKSTIPIVKQNIEQQVFLGSPFASAQAYEYVQKCVIPLYRIQAMMEAHPDQELPTVWPWLWDSLEAPASDCDEEEEEEEPEEKEEDDTYTEPLEEGEIVEENPQMAKSDKIMQVMEVLIKTAPAEYPIEQMYDRAIEVYDLMTSS
jgi:hypothetical protein